MKLKFSIHYRTAWGESLHVVVKFHSQDGTTRRQDLTMLTDNGDLWSIETAALMSRQHPVAYITYHYEVHDGEGRVLRREWDGVPRTYHFDATKDYVFPDAWHDRPLAYHLYSNAYRTAVGMPRDERVKPLAQPLFRRTVVFRVSAPQVQQGQSVAVCGSHPALGSWSPSRYLKMHYAGLGEWLLSVNALGFDMAIEYKFVVVDDATHELLRWEEGDNRMMTPPDSPTPQPIVADGQVLVLYGDHLRLAETAWRAAGVCVPVFSLRSEHSYGVGDFGDLRRLVDWAVATGMKVIQTLPVNDTTTDGRWHDSYPYNIVSAFALHPHYVDLEAAGELREKQQMTMFRRRQQELNALPYSDYEAVERVKMEYLHALYDEQGAKVAALTNYKEFVKDNEAWLKPYAEYCATKHQHGQQNQGEQHSQHSPQSFTYFVQYLLHSQLKGVADYARKKGVVLKGDLPIGVNRESAETWSHPALFNLDEQAGAPPDSFSKTGQNWGFPTYHWQDEDNGQQQKAHQHATSLTDWFEARMRHLEQYFDALRIDHVLGFFRIWEIPCHAVDGLLGHFSPALPLTVDEIAYFGLTFHKELYTKPFINDRLLERLFGIHAQYVRDTFLTRKAYNLYDLRDDYATQRQVADAFADRRDENSLWIRDGLIRLISDVLFLEDPHRPGMYHPRIGVMSEPIYEALSADEKDAFARLYNNYFFQRHSFFWGQHALKRLPAVLHNSRMLVCGEDLGMLPDCVKPVLDELRILTLEIQQMPKHEGFEFAHLDANPIRSVATISTHDMAPLRLWWEESPERRQRYYTTMLQKEGHAPAHLPAHLAEEIIARHLYCPSMLCILSLQDWLSMDSELRAPQAADERINTPSNPYNRWQWRMHLTIEELLQATRYNQKLRTMVVRSKRV